MTMLFINLSDHVVCDQILENQALGYVRGHHVSVFNIDTCYKMTFANRVCLFFPINALCTSLTTVSHGSKICLF